MVQDLFRDSTIGQIVNCLSNGRLLPYPEQRTGYVVPKHYLLPSSQRKASDEFASDAATLCGDCDKTKDASSPPDTEIKRESTITTLAADIESQKQVDDATTVPDPYLVDWEGESDPENPRYAFENVQIIIETHDLPGIGLSENAPSWRLKFPFSPSAYISGRRYIPPLSQA
jgi:DHA1 family multidrug resistance protein-like MFS transporter